MTDEDKRIFEIYKIKGYSDGPIGYLSGGTGNLSAGTSEDRDKGEDS